MITWVEKLPTDDTPNFYLQGTGNSLVGIFKE